MSYFKNGLIFHAKAGKIVGVKKASIVNVIGGDPPVGQAEGLRFNEFVELLETRGVCGSSVGQIDSLIDGSRDFRRSRTHLGQPALMYLFVAITLDREIATHLMARRQ